MLLDLKNKTLQNYVDTLINVCDFLNKQNIINNIFTALDNDYKINFNYEFDLTNKNNILGIIINNESFNAVIKVYTLTDCIKFYVDTVLYFDYGQKVIYIKLSKNTNLDVVKNSNFYFKVNNNDFCINYIDKNYNKLVMFLN